MPNVKGAIAVPRWRAMVVVGVLFIGLGAFYAWSGFNRAGHDQAVEATVLGSHEAWTSDPGGDDVDDEWLVTLRYVTADGDSVEKTIEMDDPPEARRIEVYYDTRNPEHIRLDSAANDTSVGLTLLLLGIFALVFGLWDRRQV